MGRLKRQVSFFAKRRYFSASAQNYQTSKSGLGYSEHGNYMLRIKITASVSNYLRRKHLQLPLSKSKYSLRRRQMQVVTICTQLS